MHPLTYPVRHHYIPLSWSFDSAGITLFIHLSFIHVIHFNIISFHSFHHHASLLCSLLFNYLTNVFITYPSFVVCMSFDIVRFILHSERFINSTHSFIYYHSIIIIPLLLSLCSLFNFIVGTLISFNVIHSFIHLLYTYYYHTSSFIHIIILITHSHSFLFVIIISIMNHFSIIIIHYHYHYLILLWCSFIFIRNHSFDVI